MSESASEPTDPYGGWRVDIPDALLKGTLSVRCVVPDRVPEACDGWATTVECPPADVHINSREEIVFPRHVPTECSNCGGGELAYNGVELIFGR